MADDLSDIAAHYSDDPERERNRLVRHQLEHDLTWRYLDQYLPPRGSILEVGAATGTYTLELAKRGHNLTSVDLSATLLDECRVRLADEGLQKQVRVAVADARDLSRITERGFDASLLMGPLYHLVEKEDRMAALRQVADRLRVDGIIFSTFISRYGVMGDVMKVMPDWVEDQKEVQFLMAHGRRPDHYPKVGFRGYFATVPEIAPLHEALGFETLILAGVEPAISADDEIYNRLEGEQRRLWLDLLYEISTDESTIGASRHLLYIGRKRL